VDDGDDRRHDPLVTVSALPLRGGVHTDVRNGDRAIRVAAHPDQGIITLSLWRGDTCVASHQMAAVDASKVIALVADALSVLAAEPSQVDASAS
jgi:hypothetical protein